MDLNFLKKVSLFSTLTNEELKIVAGKLKIVKCKQGEAIITEKEKSDKLYILYSGSVMVSKKMTMVDEEETLDKTFTVIKSNDYMFFGEIGLLGYRKRTADVIAKTPCEFFSVNQKDFMDISKNHPEIGFKILLEVSCKLSQILEKTNEDVLKLTTALIYALK